MCRCPHLSAPAPLHKSQLITTLLRQSASAPVEWRWWWWCNASAQVHRQPRRMRRARITINCHCLHRLSCSQRNCMHAWNALHIRMVPLCRRSLFCICISALLQQLPLPVDITQPAERCAAHAVQSLICVFIAVLHFNRIDGTGFGYRGG